MKKKYLIFTVTILLTFSYNLFADENGGYAGSYLRMGLGARSTALGNAGAADQPNGYSFFYNPALVGFLEDKIFSLSYSFLSLDRRFNFIGYSMKVPPNAGFSICWINTGVDDIRRYDNRGADLGAIDHSANAAYFNFALKFHRKFSFGLSIKYLWESISNNYTGDSFDYSSTGWGWDFGAVFRFNKQLTLAAVARDIGSKFKANTNKIFTFGGTTIDHFPNLYRLGFRYVTPYPWLRVMYDFEWSSKRAYNHCIGIEAAYVSKSENVLGENLALRLGLNGDNFVAGAGMSFKLFRFKTHLDYAFVPSIVDEGSSHIFSWQIFINKK